MLKMKKVFLFFVLCITAMSIYAQNGTVQGVITEEQNGEKVALPFANVFLEGTTYGATSDFDGNFIFKAPEGNYVVTCSFMGYTTFKQEITVTAGGNVSVSVDMKVDGVEIEGVEVVAKMNRESDFALMIEQKNATVAVEAIGANQLSAQGVSDAAQGVTKVTGISKQAGSYTINVRGLGDRYNTTTLNSLPLPSNHAEYKNINLQLFSTDIIEYIGVEKVFTSNLYGDVGGANVNIISKQHDSEPFIEVNVGTGYNSNLLNVNEFYLPNGASKYGLGNGNMPQGNYNQAKNSTYVPDNYNTFQNSWNPDKTTIKPKLDFGVKGGRVFDFKNASSLSLFATVSFENKYSYNDVLEAKYPSSNIPDKYFEGFNNSYETSSVGMFNANYTKGKNSIAYNLLALNSSNSQVKEYSGKLKDIADDVNLNKALVRRSEYERNIVLVNQIIGTHELSQGTNLNWGIAYNRVNNIMPDRRHNIFVYSHTDSIYTPSTNDNANNHRYFHQLGEQEMAANLLLSKTFGIALNNEVAYRIKLSAGYQGRFKNRSFESLQYNHKLLYDNVTGPGTIDPNNVDAYFNQPNYKNSTNPNGIFELTTFFGRLNKPVQYEGTQNIHAGLVSCEYNITENLLMLLGVRFESVYQYVDYKTTISTGENTFDNMEILPNLSLKYKINEKQNIRLSGSKTYTLPQFKERAPIQFEGITFSSVGNEYLYPSTNYNADLKWELFPNAGELFSITTFYKYIQNPINFFVMSSASDDFTYANTGPWAKVYGIEFEAKKDIIELTTLSGVQKVFAGANASLMSSKQELDIEKVKEETNGGRIPSFNDKYSELQGAAPLIANANISYNYKWNDNKNSITSTIVYSYISDRLYLLGYAGQIGNQVDKANSELDFILKTKISDLGISFKVQNILNPNIDRVQQNNSGDNLVLRYKTGVKMGFSVSYNF